MMNEECGMRNDECEMQNGGGKRRVENRDWRF
jgi:hypothetical protein